MTQITLPAEHFYDQSEMFPDVVEILINGQWYEITHIASYQIINGSWISDGLHIFIECGETEHTFNLMDQITIRFNEEKSDE